MFYIDNKKHTAQSAPDERSASKLGNGGTFVASWENLFAAVNLTTPDLVTIYNNHAPKPVKKFENRETTAKRTFAALSEHYKDWAVAPTTEAPAGEGDAPAPAGEGDAPAPATEAPAGKATNGRGRVRGTGKFAGKTVYAKRDANPRRLGTKGFSSYEIIRGKPDGVPYADYVAAGGRPQDLQWDIDHNFAEAK